MKFLNSKLKDDSGLILGIVLISLTIVGTILGSALMMSQISMESKGQSLEGLKAKNVIAQSSASKLDTLILTEEIASDLNNSKSSSNCGLPSEMEGTKISCSVRQGSEINSEEVQLQFTDNNGETHTKIIKVPALINSEEESN